MNKVKSMLLKNNAPKSLWNEVVNTTNYLVNKLPTQANQGMTPLQVFTIKKPNLCHFCIFNLVVKLMCMHHVKIEQNWKQNP
jgi:hypothetical protein